MMDLERFCLKFFLRAADVDEGVFIEIFQEWIRLGKLKGTLIDVADYRHVPEGPGVMLITHEVNYAMEHDQGEFGLSAQRKLGQGASHQERIVGLGRAAATFAALLESDRRVQGKLRLEGGKFLYMANDRLRAPNTAAAFAALKPDLEAAGAVLYPDQQVTVTRLENDPRERLSAIVQAENPVEIGTLA